MVLLLYACLFLGALTVPILGQYENLARKIGTASMIDNWSIFTGPQLAIDGNTFGQWSPLFFHSVAISKSKGAGAWWKVTFPREVYIDNIKVYHRTDSGTNRYTGSKVWVDGVEVGGLRNEVTVDHIQNVKRHGREVKITGQPGSQGYIQLAEVEVYGMEDYEDVKCYDPSGKEYKGKDEYTDDDGKTCTCGVTGIVCRCEGEDKSCPGGTYKWTDQDTCEAQCIRNPAYCSSTGDPHYKTFDGKYYDFHGQCTYQAASCGDFHVNFKNIDLKNRAPRFTLRAELVFKGITYSIANRYQAKVNGVAVQIPYIKTFTNGDIVTIANNGQLEIILTQVSKGRNPAVRVRAINAGSYIHAELWLHGSCADLTEGLCGNFNAIPHDDLTGGSPNSLGNLHQLYDEHCAAPPDPYHPCNLMEGAKEKAMEICDALKNAPFNSCHTTIPIGNEDGGAYGNCMTDVCYCLLDKSCACSQYDDYASNCIDAGVDLSDWRTSVEYCPFECPAGQTYKAAGSMPAPTCLNREPEETGKVRGCFCPNGKFLQDGVCVAASECKCLYEGKFYNVGDEIKKEGECKKCTCEDAGEMSCSSLSCDVPACTEGEILASRDDLCCPYCESDWVSAVNPDVKIKQGQHVTFTCQVDTKISKQDIAWTKDGQAISTGISNNGLLLKISDGSAEDDGAYTCTATKGESSSSADFQLSVEIPPKLYTFNPPKTNIKCKAGRKCKVAFKISKKDGEVDKKTSVKLCKFEEGKIGHCVKMKYKKKGGGSFVAKPKMRDVSHSGEYVCVVEDKGEFYNSDPITITVSAKKNSQ